MKDIEYLYSLKKYLLIVADIFILSLIVGLLVSVKNPMLSENYLETFKESFGWIKTLDPLLIMLVIFLNNAIKSLLALVLGVGLGIVPVLFIAGNGIILSMLADVISRQHGTLFVIAALLPHGIIEVPMVLISAGIGLRLGYAIYLSLKGLKIDIKTELRQGIRFYMRVILPLLFIAAVIETFVTPLIAMQFY
ncbi:MAG: stage II sporulation protein M [Euryarchaeota archaeon]|nr:stage II sporulation protein M [Euryarchaeota archaeon]MBU4492503.1 stage II sporulation protein M [Euryarchaeota archaeon]MCG2727445.1 stage II sporulation protein M [Candidatus Methanoperedenaceae archaeon]